MSTVNINILDSSSVTRGINKIEKFVDRLSRLDEVFRRLAEIGVKVAQTEFDAAQAFYDGDGEVSVEMVKTDDGYEIHANGQAVCYLEFGAGVYYNGFGSYEGTIPDGIDRIGEHDTKGGTGVSMGSRQAWGFYAGGKPNKNKSNLVITHGNPSANAMYHAVIEMEKQAVEIFNEVFYND